jgi:prepilin-type N-terminal cleavage/methylation domain-containing protein
MKTLFGSTKTKADKGFSLIELMVAVAMISVLAATGLAMYGNYVTRSKTTEASVMLSKLTQAQVEYFSSNDTFLETNAINFPPATVKRSVDFTAEPDWSALRFSIADPIYFAYQSVSPSSTEVSCEALGDFNGDGVTSLFQRQVSQTGGTLSVGGLLIFDELE